MEAGDSRGVVQRAISQELSVAEPAILALEDGTVFNGISVAPKAARSAKWCSTPR